MNDTKQLCVEYVITDEQMASTRDKKHADEYIENYLRGSIVGALVDELIVGVPYNIKLEYHVDRHPYDWCERRGYTLTVTQLRR